MTRCRRCTNTHWHLHLPGFLKKNKKIVFLFISSRILVGLLCSHRKKLFIICVVISYENIYLTEIT